MFGMSMAPQLEQRITPAMLNLAQLLQLPSMGLHQLVQRELAENPALEEVESYEQACARCGGLVVERICIACASVDAIGEGPARRDEQLDPLLLIAAPRSFAETLLSDLCVSVADEDRPIAVALVGSLDERGFLAEGPELVADLLGAPIERVRRVLERLRAVGPPGIATRDPQECLLAQIDALAAQGRACPHARTIVAEHFADLGAGRTAQIARRLRISAEELDAARAFIRRHLWPYPALAAADEAAPPQRNRHRTADIAILRRGDAFVVEVLHSPRRALRLSPIYQDLARQAAALPDHEREHVREYIARARMFLSNLQQRESTLKRIGEAIVARQAAFLTHGVRHLAPLTRAEIAAELGLHESTVSRATADKAAQLPDGALLPLREFFVAARSAQDVLRELIAGEPRPLSDDELAQLLSERGYPLARRTVAKYRDILKIPPSHLR